MAGENFASRIKKTGAMRSTYGDTTFTGGVRNLAPPTEIKQARKNNVSKFIDKADKLATQGFDMATSVARAAPRYALNRVKGIAGSAETAFYGLNPMIARTRQQIATKNEQQLDLIQDKTIEAYRAGKMSEKDYTKTLKDISNGYQEVSKFSTENARLADPKRINEGILETATNALALGSFGLVKTALPKNILGKSVKSLEDKVQKVPAIAPLLERNAAGIVNRTSQKLAGETMAQYVGREGRHVASALLIKQPLVYQMNFGDGQEVYKQILDGQYDDALKRAAWMSTQLLNGGPLGAALKLGRTGYNKAGKLAFGTGSYIDELGKLTNGDAQSYTKYLNSLDRNSKEFKEAEKTLRIAQEIGIQVTGKAKNAAEATVDAWLAQGLDLTKLGPKQGVKLLRDWADAMDYFTRQARTGKIRGIKPEDYKKYALVRWDVNAKNALADKFENMGNDVNEIETILKQWEMLPGSAANNRNLQRQIEKIVNEEFQRVSDVPVNTRIANRIREISAVSVMPKGIDSATKKYLAKRGYAIAEPYRAPGSSVANIPKTTLEETRKLVTTAIKGGDDVFEKGELPVPALASIARLFDKTGLSPQTTSSLAHRKLSTEVAANLSGTVVAKNIGMTKGIEKDQAGRVILGKLQQYIDEKQPNKLLNVAVAGQAPGPAITDIRQLHWREITEALGVDKADAKIIQRAILKGYADVELEYRGLGDKIVDYLYEYNPLQKYYTRIQSALRYTYNPFFRFQEKVETSLLSRAQANTFMWGKNRAELDDIAAKLDNSGLFKTGLSGEAAQDLTLGRVTATITQGQKRNIAGLASKMAAARGVTVEELIRDYGDDVGDALRVVVQYPNKGILNSSLARTLNIAFFPIRYNAKVTALAAEIISKEPPVVQMAIINSIFNAKDWLNSDEGIKWRAEHADALALLSWATPIGSIQYFLKLFGGDARLADVGSIGGLPLGVLTQMLDSQGIIKLNNPYVEPSTGDVLPKYIPETAKARASVAITDMLGSLFTYPGRILGLPGKQQSLNKLSQELTGSQGVDFEKLEQDDRLTDLQRNYIRVLKGDHSDEALDALYYSPLKDGYQGYTLPPLTLPAELKPQIQQRTGLPTKAELKAAKKASRGARGKKVKPLPQPIPSK